MDTAEFVKRLSELGERFDLRTDQGPNGKIFWYSGCKNVPYPRVEDPPAEVQLWMEYFDYMGGVGYGFVSARILVRRPGEMNWNVMCLDGKPMGRQILFCRPNGFDLSCIEWNSGTEVLVWKEVEAYFASLFEKWRTFGQPIVVS